MDDVKIRRAHSSALVLLILAGTAGCRPDPPASPAPSPPPERAAPSPSTPPIDPDPGSAEAAAAVLRTYYEAIDQKDYPRAYRCWAREGAASGQTFEAFVRGFAETKSVKAEVGPPSPIEGAAGSRYVTVPVAIEAETTGGQSQRFAGTYVLRRSEVDGATPEQRAWHLDSANIVRMGG